MHDALPAGATEALAAEQVSRVWHAEPKPSKLNAFHVVYEALWQARLADLARLALAHELPGSTGRFRDLQSIPGFADLVDAEFVARVLGDRARALAAVAADPHLLTDTRMVSNVQTVLVVQHVQSGLRARFTITAKPEVSGNVMSDPEQIPSLDRDGVEPIREQYEGLGIGTRIYRHAATLHPAVRWGPGAVTAQSAGVRRKLHARDPYFWASSCAWCGEHVVDWQHATPSAFDAHP